MWLQDFLQSHSNQQYDFNIKINKSMEKNRPTFLIQKSHFNKGTGISDICMRKKKLTSTPISHNIHKIWNGS